MFLWRSYQPIRSPSEGIYTYHFDFFYTGRHMNNKETDRNYFDVRCGNSQGMQKMTKKWEE